MMHPSCLLRVEEWLAQEDDGMLKNVVRNLCANYSDSLRMKDLKAETQPFTHSFVRDCRLGKLLFHDFRTYPSKDGEVDYGLSLKNKSDKLSSFLFIGKNGSGKSTLYNALQKIYLGYSDYALKIKEDENKYLTFGFGKDKILKDKAWSLSYCLASDQLNPKLTNADQGDILSVPAFFCSDLDVDELKMSDNLYLWILKQMGYEHLQNSVLMLDHLMQNLKKQLEALTDGKLLSYSEYNSLFTAILRYDEQHLQEIIYGQGNELDKIQNPFFFIDIWDKLNQLYVQNKDEGAIVNLPLLLDAKAESSKVKFDNQKQALVKLYQKLYQIVKDREGMDWKLDVLFPLKDEQKLSTQYDSEESSAEQLKQNISLLKKSRDFLTKFQDAMIRQFLDIYGVGISSILTSYSCHRETYTFQYTKDLKNLFLKIHVSLKGDYEAEPRNYFNEFRFKLYCVTMKTAISFYWMQEHKISLPVVIDDVFNANDFDNSLKLEHFSYFLKLSYNEHVLQQDFQIPLQLIMMSHDDLVINAFLRGYQGVCYSDIGKLKGKDFPICMGRIYRLEEIDEYYNQIGLSDSYKSIYQYV